VGRKYFDGLPEGLRWAIVKDENMGLLISVADYEDACHGSAGTPLGTHAGREALGLQDARTAIRT
jgi:hypothetical protein